MENINYSIIIPHKDIPRLLQRCLDSIPVRDDIQVIVVDDNSDVGLVDFKKFPLWRGKDYIPIFTKEGRGAGYARNVGLKYAKGKWLLFADADDFFNYCINSILDEYTEDNSDIVFFKESSMDGETYVNVQRADFTNGLIDDYYNNPTDGLKMLRYLHDVPHGKLIKRLFVERNNIQFQETQIDNDTKFSYLSGHYAKIIRVDRRAIYCLTYRSSSTTYTITESKLEDKIRVHAERAIFLTNHRVVLPNRFHHTYIGRLVDLKQHGDNKMYDKCINILSEYGINQNTVENMVKKSLYDKQKEKDSTNYYMKSALELFTGRRLFCIPYKTFTRILLIIKHSIM